MSEESKDRSGYTGLEPNTFQISTTRPDCLYRHDISDEELTMLMNSSRDSFTDAMWTSIGAFIGVAPSAISSISDYYKTETMSVLSLFQILIFGISTALIIAFLCMCKNRPISAQALAEKIRARTATRN